jgi:hypothetical protein
MKRKKRLYIRSLKKLLQVSTIVCASFMLIVSKSSFAAEVFSDVVVVVHDSTLVEPTTGLVYEVIGSLNDDYTTFVKLFEIKHSLPFGKDQFQGTLSLINPMPADNNNVCDIDKNGKTEPPYEFYCKFALSDNPTIGSTSTIWLAASIDKWAIDSHADSEIDLSSAQPRPFSATMGNEEDPLVEDPIEDDDGDSTTDDADNCPLESNPDQADEDNDGVGDMCDLCLNSPNPDKVEKDFSSLHVGCDLEMLLGDEWTNEEGDNPFSVAVEEEKEEEEEKCNSDTDPECPGFTLAADEDDIPPSDPEIFLRISNGAFGGTGCSLSHHGGRVNWLPLLLVSLLLGVIRASRRFIARDF